MMNENRVSPRFQKLCGDYIGKLFIFRQIYDDNPGWQDGDNAEIIKLYNPWTDKVNTRHLDLWQARNKRNGELCDAWNLEMYCLNGITPLFKTLASKPGSSNLIPIFILCPKCKKLATSVNWNGTAECKEDGKIVMNGLIHGRHYKYKAGGFRW